LIPALIPACPLLDCPSPGSTDQHIIIIIIIIRGRIFQNTAAEFLLKCETLLLLTVCFLLLLESLGSIRAWKLDCSGGRELAVVINPSLEVGL
jgi:hypothetical protein